MPESMFRADLTKSVHEETENEGCFRFQCETDVSKDEAQDHTIITFESAYFYEGLIHA